MKTKVKVLLLLITMICGALGVNAQIAEGQYKLKNKSLSQYIVISSGSVKLDESTDVASVFDITPVAGGYTIQFGGKYIKSELWELAFVDDETVLNIEPSNGAYVITDNDGNGLYEMWGGVWFDTDYANYPNRFWILESIGGGEGGGPEESSYMTLSEDEFYHLKGKEGMYLEVDKDVSEIYGNSTLNGANASIFGSQSPFGLWRIKKEEGKDYVYLHNASTNAYLGQANGTTLSLVVSKDEAGKYYIYDDGSIYDSENNKYVAVTGRKIEETLSILNEKPDINWQFISNSYVHSLTLNTSGFATICLPFNFTCEDAVIYAATFVDDANNIIKLQETGVGKSGEGYILFGTPESNVALTLDCSSAFDGNEESILTGTLIRQTSVHSTLKGEDTTENGFYYFGFKGDGFVPARSENVPANKAIFIRPTDSQASAFTFNFDEEGTTGMATITTAGTNKTAFDLQGRVCNGAKCNGLYIVGGRKVLR